MDVEKWRKVRRMNSLEKNKMIEIAFPRGNNKIKNEHRASEKRNKSSKEKHKNVFSCN